MTDKQIIIDGVDVSGCSVYKNSICLISKEKCNARCDYAAYYFEEQLKRLQAELEGKDKLLQEIKEIAEDIINNDVYENSDSKAERILEKIKEVI